MRDEKLASASEDARDKYKEGMRYEVMERFANISSRKCLRKYFYIYFYYLFFIKVQLN